MTVTHLSSPLALVPMAPKDPILGVSESFAGDPNPRKVNLGVGIYSTDEGKIPLLECVRRAESARVEAAPPRGYLPIDGLPAYDKAVQQLIFADTPAAREGRIVTVQALGGTGGLKVGADFLKRIAPGAQVWISDPSWENHRALFEGAGFKVNEYPYYDPRTHGVRFDAMLATLAGLPAGSIVLLHACCHNPTGVDLSPDQWQRVLQAVQLAGLIPFLDLAYQGFGDGIEEDAYAARLFAGATAPVFLSSSFSKSFSLYGERVGALSIVAANPDEGARALSQLKRLVRTNYSNPPMHGSQLVAAVLNTPELRSLWEQELSQMRERIKTMRQALVEKVQALAPAMDIDFVRRQRGMFSYSGLTIDQVTLLRERYAIYAIDTGRICVAALNSRNVDYVAAGIADVMQS